VTSDGFLVADAVGTTVVCEGSTRLKVISRPSEGLEVAGDSVLEMVNIEVGEVAEAISEPVDTGVEAEDAVKPSAT